MKRESYGRIMLGLLTGTAFGFLLHKGRASEHEAISGQLLLEDFSVGKIMATASAVGAAGTYALNELKQVDLKIKPLNTGGIVLGGTMFGAGMALLGYCPGTSLAAIGEGHKDAAVGALGMLGGALAFIKAYPYIKPVIEKGAVGEKTLPQLTGSSPWLWVAGLAGTVALGANLLKK
ncbi:MAG: hypothetical protein VR65_09860 [Desulfobulbaceae bacterium BRH_c16a]|nr:MAG: hypothetical protein VR65_09860 [Desulfobulbaceae bacterium BRH_c16a]